MDINSEKEKLLEVFMVDPVHTHVRLGYNVLPLELGVEPYTVGSSSEWILNPKKRYLIKIVEIEPEEPMILDSKR